MTQARLERQPMRLSELDGATWRDVQAPTAQETRAAIDGRRHVWVDMIGNREELTAQLREVVNGSELLNGIEPGRAGRGGFSPPEYPPKAKAFRHCVFVRAYWLGIPEGSDRLVAQEIHVIAGRTFAITMRYKPVAWDLEGSELTPQPYADGEAGLQPREIRKDLQELRDRLSAAMDKTAFGLELAAVTLDRVVDSLFDSLNALRKRADGLEGYALSGDWLWQKRPDVETKMLGLRRLLRQVRWAFMPSDEIDELRSGPFINIESEARGITARLADLGREADRAVEAAKDVTDQVQHAVEMVHTMKADRLNNTTYVLTLVATVLLIPTIIAGIYGMNFRFMPLLRWRLGFWTFVTAMVVLGVLAWLGMRSYLRRQ